MLATDISPRVFECVRGWESERAFHFPRNTCTGNGADRSSRAYSRMKIRMKDESRTCRIPAQCRKRVRQASTVVASGFPTARVISFHSLAFRGVEALDLSHPSNPVSMHLLLTSYITITPHAAPFAQLFASRPRTFPFFGIDVHRLHSRRERSSIRRAFNTRQRSRSGVSAGKINELERRVNCLTRRT